MREYPKSFLLENCVGSDLAERDIDPQDRRYVTISLTESGSRLFEGIEVDMNSYFGIIDRR